MDMKKQIHPASFTSNFSEAPASHIASVKPDIMTLKQMRLGKNTAISVTDLLTPGDDLAIKDIKAWTLREPVSKRAFTIVKITTNSGVIGFGESAPLSGAEFSLAKKTILGITATSFEAIAPFLAGVPTARAALNIGMLDIVGKVTKAPVFQLLGGPTRVKARVFAELWGDSESALLKSMTRAQEAGYKAFMVPLPPTVSRNQGQAYVLAAKKRLDALRAAGGDDSDFVLDADNRLTPGDAQMISAAIERFHVLWFNEPCPPVNIGALKKLAGENVTPIGAGRYIIEGSEIQNLLREDAVDIIRPDIGLNGISQIRRMAAIAETSYVAVGPNHHGGPVGTAAALHLAASIPNFFIQQIPFPVAEEDRRMRSELTLAPVEIIKEGFSELLVGEGLGITLNEKNLEKYKED
jgi:galactonate dehydratase